VEVHHHHLSFLVGQEDLVVVERLEDLLLFLQMEDHQQHKVMLVDRMDLPMDLLVAVELVELVLLEMTLDLGLVFMLVVEA
jgi:hypothetical protein